MTDKEIEKFVSELISVETLAEVVSLPPDAKSVFIKRLDDAKIEALSRFKNLQQLMQDGNSSVSDEGLKVLGKMLSLKEVDLEWSRQISDEGLKQLHRLKNLRWLDIGFCPNITEGAIKRLQKELPDCEIITSQLTNL